MGKIIDLSHHQPPSKIDYDKMAKELDLAIIRTQYGSKTRDKYYKIHYKELQKRDVPTAAYAWVRGVSISDMEKEATNFYIRTEEFNPTFWFLDVEEISMNDMRSGVSAYAKKLRSLGAKKVGVYIAHHLYKQLNINTAEFDAVWIPRYGDKMPDYPCDLWQYTDSGKVAGYSGNVDLNKLTGSKPLDYFTGEIPDTNGKKYRITTGTFKDAEQLVDGKNKFRKVSSALLYEKADSTNLDPTYRIVTGTFDSKEEADKVAADLKKAYGWVVYITEE